MAMELEFWLADGQNGEILDFAVRTHAWNLLANVERYRRNHVYIILRHTSRQRGSWIIWVKPGYCTGTAPAVGRLEEAL